MIKGWILLILQSSSIKSLLKVTQKWSQGSSCMDKGKWMLGGYRSPWEGHPCPYSLRKEHLWWLKQQQLQWGHCELGWQSSSSELSINVWLRHFKSDSEHFLVLRNLNGPHWQKWPIAGPLQHGGNFIFSQGRHSHWFRVHMLPCSFATALSYPILLKAGGCCNLLFPSLTGTACEYLAPCCRFVSWTQRNCYHMQWSTRENSILKSITGPYLSCVK